MKGENAWKAGSQGAGSTAWRFVTWRFAKHMAMRLLRAPCSPQQQDSCVEGYRCDPTGVQGECVALVALHGKCMNTFQCAQGLFCSLDTDTCEVVSQAGEDCRPTSWGCAGTDCVAFSVYCADGLVCVPKAAPSGCFSDHDCGAEFCCADENNVGSCQPDAFCKAPLGKCISH